MLIHDVDLPNELQDLAKFWRDTVPYDAQRVERAEAQLRRYRQALIDIAELAFSEADEPLDDAIRLAEKALGDSNGL